MRLKVHENATQFIAVADAFLRSAEAEYSIIAGPAARMARAPNDDDAGSYLATVSAGGEVVAAALQGVSGGLVLTAAPDAAATLIAADLAGRGRRPNGVVGPLASCEGFARAWRERTGQAHVLRFHLRHFELTDPPPAPAVQGALRPPGADEAALLVAWEVAFASEAGLPDEPEKVRRNMVRRLERGHVRVWDDGGPVACCGFGEGAAQTARIGPVYTPPERRGRHYASAMVAQMARELFASGRRAIFLTTDVANPTSNGIYQRIGFRPVADHYHFDLIGSAP
jgi:RimJ/RimL family protein N-acetyltransferase